MREAENGGDSSESEVEGGEEVGYPHPPVTYTAKTKRRKDIKTKKTKTKMRSMLSNPTFT